MSRRIYTHPIACVICNLANLSHLAVNKVPSILSHLFLRIWLVVGYCEGEGDPLSLYSLSKTNGSECWQNKQHNISSDASFFLGCHRWVSVTAGNNWVFTRRHFECVLKYQPSIRILGWMEFLSYVWQILLIYISIPKLGEKRRTFCWPYRCSTLYMSRFITSYYTNRCQQVTRLTFTHMLYSQVHKCMVNIVSQKNSKHSVVPSRHWGRSSFSPHGQMSDIIQQHSENMPMSGTLGFTDEELRWCWRIQNRPSDQTLTHRLRCLKTLSGIGWNNEMFS